tara:strand:- start:1092 stop:2513 length:1422 start_codon:yes stop_codon:yes gene_type:complete
MKFKNLNPGISLCMIVKNEERSLSRCIKSVKSLVDQIIIVDTGSTDNTINIAKNLGAEVFNFKWCDDFSAARNESIKYAKYQWVLILDADEIIDEYSTSEIKKIIKNNKPPVAFEFRVLSDTGSQNPNESRVIRMFSNGFGILFKNRVHEQITSSIKEISAQVLRTNSKIIHDGYNQEYVDQNEKQERNISLLKQMIKEEPDFYYWPYNLGISYMAIGKNDLGIKYLKKSYEEKLHVNVKAAILNLLGGIYKTEERWEELKPVVEKSTKLVKNQFLGHILLAEYHNYKKNYSDAIEAIDIILNQYDNLIKNGSDLNNDLSYSLNYLLKTKAIYVHGSGKIESAKMFFDNVMANLKKDYFEKKLDHFDNMLYEDSLKYSIGCARDINDAESVVNLVNEYIKIFPEDINGYSLLGEANIILKKYSDALKVYLQADSKFPNNPDFQKKIATMFTLLGNEKKAEEWLYKMAGITDLP